MLGLECLRNQSIQTGALCVLTARSINEPLRLFDFFVSAGIDNVAFNIEETEGMNERSSLTRYNSLAEIVNAYTSFIETFLALNCQAGTPLRVREVQAMIQRIRHFRKTKGPPRDSERMLGAILTMTRDGILSSWSPELASIPGVSPSSFAIGNVMDIESIDDIFFNPKAIARQSDIDLGVDICKQSCQYYDVCGGGSPSNKYFENGTVASAETMHCATQMKALAEVLLAQRFQGFH